MKTLYSILIFVTFFLAPFGAHAKVIFHDDVVLRGMPFMLKAETRGKFFPRGGQMVEFFVNDKSIGRNLSGGDGIALREFIPEKRGLYKITVESGGERDNGYVLSLNNGEGVVFIDVEGGIFDRPFSMRHREGSREAIESISKRFPVVYLQTGMLDKELLEKWLKEKGFQDAPLLKWDDGDVLNAIYEKGLKAKALVAAPAVLLSLEEKDFKVFSFEDAEDTEWVKDWKEIDKKLH